MSDKTLFTTTEIGGVEAKQQEDTGKWKAWKEGDLSTAVPGNTKEEARDALIQKIKKSIGDDQL